MNNNEAVKSAVQRVNEMSNNNANRNFQKYDNYKAKVDAIVTLEDVDNINKLVTGAESLAAAINKSLKGLEDSSKEYKQMSELYNTLVSSAKDLSDENNDASKNAKIIVDLYKQMQKSQGSMSKQATVAAKEFLDANQDALDIANEFKSIMSKSSETFGKNLKNNLVQVKDELRNIANAFNLQKLVTGGLGIEDLRKMQSNVQISMNLDQSGFMGVQSELLAQNRQIAEQTGEMYLSFNDAVSYMSNIQEYNVKNYSQMTAMYKQIATGTKYLNLTNSNIGSLVRATNAIADDQFMTRQMALIAALGSDSTVAENSSDLADYMGANATAVNARYSNSDDMLRDAMGIKSTADALFGNESSLVDNLMAEIMGKSDFSQLSEGTKMLLAYTGQATNVMQQMRSGNVDFNNIVSGVLSGTGNLNQYQRTTLENFGLDSWVTLGGSYTNNQGEFYDLLNKQNDILGNIDLTNEEELKRYIDEQAEMADTRTGYEKFMDGFANQLGLQNQNWTSILGFTQGISAMLSALSGFISGAQLLNLIAIRNNTAISAGKSTLGGNLLGKFKGLGSSISGAVSGLSIGNATGWAALGGAGLIAGGTIAGINDAIKMQGSTGNGWLADGARGLFLGTGASNHTKEENTGSTLGNTAKWAAIGAGIGTFIAPGVGTAIGGLVGGVAGLVGGLIGNTIEDNTKAVEENSKVIGKSNDSIVNNSGIGYLLNGTKPTGAAGDVTYGVGSGSTPNTGGKGAGYPWVVTSPFGNRTLDNGDNSFHNGMDFGIPTGTPIGAPVGGKISSVSIDPRNTYPKGPKSAGSGIFMVGDNGVTYQFWHLSDVGVKKGQSVTPGQTIGLSGNTGYSTGAHLHFGTKLGGSWVNPSSYVTESLFSASGYAWTPELGIDTSQATSGVSAVSDYSNISREAVFSTTGVSSNGKGATSEKESSTEGLATSADIDRLIEVIQTLNQNQNDQKDFLRALAGKNTFTYNM